MIFVRDRRAEESKDAIASGLSHVTFVAMDRFHHQGQHWINNGTGFLGIKVLHQRHRAFDVGKEGGDSFAFTIARTACFHCRLFGEDALGEMRRSPESGVRSPESGIICRLSFSPFPRFSVSPFPFLPFRKRGAAFGAEFGLRWILARTALTAVLEWSATPDTELRFLGIFGLAIRAAH